MITASSVPKNALDRWSSDLGIMQATQAVVGAPVHAFRSVGELLHHIRAPPQLHSYFLCLPEAAVVQVFMLARIRQTIAPPAGEQLASAVQYRDPTPAVSTAGIDGTNEPRATTAKMACRPGD
jgi:hypothetical protein